MGPPHPESGHGWALRRSPSGRAVVPVGKVQGGARARAWPVEQDVCRPDVRGESVDLTPRIWGLLQEERAEPSIQEGPVVTQELAAGLCLCPAFLHSHPPQTDRVPSEAALKYQVLLTAAPVLPLPSSPTLAPMCLPEVPCSTDRLAHFQSPQLWFLQLQA